MRGAGAEGCAGIRFGGAGNSSRIRAASSVGNAARIRAAGGLCGVWAYHGRTAGAGLLPLAGAGLARRERDPDDGRNVFISATPAGRARAVAFAALLA